MNCQPIHLIPHNDCKGACLSFLALFIFISSIAQYDIRVETFTVDNGLLQSTVHCMHQDKYGFLWLGTFDGLNKYDGYRFTVIKDGPPNKKGLLGKFARSIAGDKNGILWVGTFNGLNRLNTINGEVEQFLINPQDLTSHNESINNVFCVLEDRKGLVWTGTPQGINIFDYRTKKFEHFTNIPGDSTSLSNRSVKCIYEDRNGNIWVGTADGLNVFNAVTKKFKQYKHDAGRVNSISNSVINFIYEYNNGKFLIGTEDGGLNDFDASTQRFKYFLHDPDNPKTISGNTVSSIIEFKKDLFWITTNGGLTSFDLKTLCFTNLLPLPDKNKKFQADNYGKLLKDFEGNVWISWGNFLQKYNPRLQYFGHYTNNPADKNSLSNNRVWCMREDKDGFLWLGTLGGGLNRFDRIRHQWQHYFYNPGDPSSISDDNVWDLCESRDGKLWITTDKGLDCMDRVTGKFKHYRFDKHDPNSISDGFFLSNVIEDRAGNIWISTRNGLNRFDRKTEKFHHYVYNAADSNSLSSNQVRSLLEDRHGNIWVSSSHMGLNCLDTATGKFKRYAYTAGNENSIINMTIHCILEDRNGKIWIGGNKGIDCIEPFTGKVEHYFEKDGLSSDVVLRMEEDKTGGIWITGNNGISRFDPRTKKFSCYNISDGLQSREFSSNCGGQSKRTGEIFFGGLNGFNIFHPDSIRDEDYKPVILISKLRHFNQDSASGLPVDESILDKKSVLLLYNDNLLSFEFLSLSLNKPLQNLYAYQLNGLSSRWVNLGTKREVTFAGLAPGKYSLLVKGSNGDGIWNDIPAKLDIVILPPWYRTWWFYSLCILAIAAIIYALFQNRLQQKLRILQVRNRLHRDLHDDVGATLSSVKAYSEILKNSPDNQVIAGLIQDNSTEMLERLELIAWATNPEYDNFKSLKSRMIKFAGPLCRAKNIRWNINTGNVNEEIMMAGEVRQNILLVFKETINNMIKYAEATDCSVNVFIKNNLFILKICDNGKGFDDNIKAAGTGHRNMQKRTSNLNGKLVIDSSPSKGTTISMTLPYPFKINGRTI